MKKYKLPLEEDVIKEMEIIKEELQECQEGYVLSTKGIVGLIYNIIEDYNK